MKNFLIAGCIVDDETQRYCREDVTPAQVHAFLKGLAEGEEVVFEISSPGGSCTAGIAIANMIRSCSIEGHRSTAHVIGLAASMASVIACSCDRVQVDSTAFVMIHNPWTCVTGDAEVLRKEADNLDKFKQALVSVYQTKFSVDATRIESLMDDETWMLGEDMAAHGFNGEILPSEKTFTAQACLVGMERQALTYRKMPINLKLMIGKDQMQDNDKTVDQGQQKNLITEEEVEKRVSGMQSAMARQMESMKNSYEARINDLQVQLDTKEKELTDANCKVISLNQSLEKASAELQETASAIEALTKALDTLNTNVNTPAEELPTMEEGLAKCKTPSEKVAFISSGKYIKKGN